MLLAAYSRCLLAVSVHGACGSGLLVPPGMINAHQHLYQVGLRSIPELERATLGPWLAGLGRSQPPAPPCRHRYERQRQPQDG